MEWERTGENNCGTGWEECSIGNGFGENWREESSGIERERTTEALEQPEDEGAR